MDLHEMIDKGFFQMENFTYSKTTWEDDKALECTFSQVVFNYKNITFGGRSD